MINQKELEKFLWKDFAIAKINDGDAIVIILMYNSLEIGNKFFEEILSKNEFTLKAAKHPESLKYRFTIDFVNTDYFIGFDTDLTANDYPPLEWLGLGTPTYLTNGKWNNSNTQKGKEYTYNPDLLPLNESLKSIPLEEAIANQFSKALRIEFWKETEQPSIVILVFDKPKALTAFNDLLDMVSNKSTFLKLSESDLLTVSFIDAVEDFHITIPNLNYDKNKLNEFKNSLPKNTSFGFCLGLNNPDGGRPFLLPTKKEFEIITLAGYID